MVSRFIACWLISCSSAFAAPVQWTIDNLMLDSGHQVVGAFEYDADIATYSNINIQVLGAEEGYFISELLYTGDYSEIDLVSFGSTFMEFEQVHDGRWKYSLDINFGANLTNSGGVVSISVLEQAQDSFFVLDQRSSNEAGTISAIPIPAAAWLFGSAFAGLFLTRRRYAAP
jgi:hypothetical protein